MSYKSVLSFTVAVMSSACFARGGMDAGGGDTVVCRSSPLNFLEGNYNLDFVLTIEDLKNGDLDIVPVESWEESKDRIYFELLPKIPALAASFKDFSYGLQRPLGENSSPPQSTNRLWLPAKLWALKDEGVGRPNIPYNCYHPFSIPAQEPWVQTVIRTPKSGYILYQYYKPLFDELYKSTPLQFSFLVVHEWLRDHVKDPKAIRRINRFLHSVDSELMTGSEVLAELHRLGLRNAI